MTVTFSPPLGTPEQEAELCLAAWEANPSEYGWHIHHEQLFERREYAIGDRIDYILTQKSQGERPLRLRLLRPMSAADYAEVNPIRAKRDAEVNAIWAKRDAEAGVIRAKRDAEVNAIWAKRDAEVNAIRAKRDAEVNPIHAAACPGCPWDGSTIFPAAK